MWQRKDLKARGKAAFKANYWKCVLITFIFSLIGGMMGGYSSVSMRSQISDPSMFMNMSSDELSAFLAGFLVVYFIVLVITCFIGFFVFNPLTVGAGRFYLVNSYSPAEVSELGYGFSKGNYGRGVLALFLEGLLIALGCIVIVPGLILSYSYRLVPYILADDPYIKATDALKKSRAMMKGHKWRSFVLDLSFIGWWILAGMTMGILIIFWVAPYVSATDAELYKAIKGEYEGTAAYNGGYCAQPQNPDANVYQNNITQ